MDNGRVDKLTLSLCNPICEGPVQCPARSGGAQVPVQRHSKMQGGEGEAISRIEMSSPGSEGDLSCPD